MDRARLSLNVTDKHLGFKFQNVSGGVLELDKMRLVFNNTFERNRTTPMNVTSHHISVKFQSSGVLKYVSFNIETLGAQ
jgi:hypothetical protein